MNKNIVIIGDLEKKQMLLRLGDIFEIDTNLIKFKDENVKSNELYTFNLNNIQLISDNEDNLLIGEKCSQKEIIIYAKFIKNTKEKIINFKFHKKKRYHISNNSKKYKTLFKVENIVIS